MAVFPETMNRLEPNDVRKSLEHIERYIAYMTERVEHANANSEKVATELLARIASLEAKVDALEKKENNEGGA